MTPVLVPVNDFSLYWVAAKQLLSGQNCYVPASSHGLVQLFSLTNQEPLVMFGPPWTVPVILWIGFLPFQLAQLLWTMVLVSCLGISVVWLWELYGEKRSPLWAGLLTVTFLPVLATFLLAQIGPILLLGLTGFLRFHERRPYVAGAFLYLIALKPHLALLLWPALVLWALRGCWKPLTAFFVTISAANLFALVLRPSVFRDYKTMLAEHHVAFYETPTLGSILRHTSGYAALQYLLVGLALAWFLRYWQTRASRWDWKTGLPLLLLVSTLAAPYAWFSDQIILLPALFYAASRTWEHSLARIVAVAVGYIATNAAALVFVLNRQMSAYAWIVVAWLLLYEISVWPAKAGEQKVELVRV
jgi:Glycosyltransferase family 87